MYRDKGPGQRIRRLRESAGLSPDELAEKTGTDGPSADTIARIEAGMVRPFGLFLATIAEVLLVTPDFILSGRDEPEDEIVSFARREFQDTGLRQDFVNYVRQASFRNRNLTTEELRVFKREFLRDRRRKGLL